MKQHTWFEKACLDEQFHRQHLLLQGQPKFLVKRFIQHLHLTKSYFSLQHPITSSKTPAMSAQVENPADF